MRATHYQAFYIDERQSPATHLWTYGEQSEWAAPGNHRECGGPAQSPIDIERTQVIPNTQLRLLFYNYDQAIKFTIQNAHHTIKLNPILAQQDEPRPPYGVMSSSSSSSSRSAHSNNTSIEDEIEREIETSASSNASPTNENNLSAKLKLPQSQQQQKRQQQQQHVHDTQLPDNVAPSNAIDAADATATTKNTQINDKYNGAPSIKLDWLDDGNNEFKLRDIHFHWAERRDNGSEHAIDGRRAAMEMHLVHIKHGLDKSKIGITSDSIAVISVLIESHRRSNADFNPIVNVLTRINASEHAQEVEYKSLNALLPDNLSAFYTYSGSLTTPPCYQVVNWIVMEQRLFLNAKQIELFRNLYAPPASGSDESATTLIMPNIRQLQPLNGRHILASFRPSGKLMSATEPSVVHDSHQPTVGSSNNGVPDVNYMMPPSDGAAACARSASQAIAWTLALVSCCCAVLLSSRV